MARFARVRGLPLGPSFAGRGSFAPEQQQRDLAGAHSLQGAYALAVEQEREHRIAAYQEAVYELRLAKERREEAEHMAKAERQLKFETMMADALPKLMAINPADPQAFEKRYEIAKQYPELFHEEKGIPTLKPYWQEHERLSESIRKQQDDIDAKKEAASQRAQEITDRRRESAEDRASLSRELAQMRADTERQGKLGYARGKYETADDESKRIKEQLDATNALIDEQTAKKNPDEESQGHLKNMIRSRDKFQQELNRHQSTMKGLEAQFPELNPAYTPAKKEAPVRAPDTEQLDVPPIRETAPVSGGTLTPTGDMAPLGGETPAPVESQPVGEDQVLPLTKPAKQRPPLSDIFK